MQSPVVCELAPYRITDDEIEGFMRSVQDREFSGLSISQAIVLNDLASVATSPRRNSWAEIGLEDEMVAMNPDFKAAIDREVRGSQYIGTVDGRLDQINIHNPDYVHFTVYPRSGHKVSAQAPRDLAAEIHGLLGQFVEVSGRVEHRRNDPYPHSVRSVTSLRKLGSDDVDPAGLIGALSELYAAEPPSEIMVRKLRDADVE